jgi:hypothetical protein
MLRADVALHALLGIKRFPGDDTLRDFFHRFGAAHLNAFFDALGRWQMQRLPPCAEGYTLDLDSTVFERYGRQEGALPGYNPNRRGGVSHHPLLAVLAETRQVLHAWLRSGNARASRGAVDFLREALARLPADLHIRCLRADSGFFDNGLLAFLEEKTIPYLIVARRTHGLKPLLPGLEQWMEIDEVFSIGEFRFELHGSGVSRRFLVVRERLAESGQKARQPLLLDVPGYRFRLLVTNRTEPALTLWRDYNEHATIEQRIRELKDDLGAGGFCMKSFWATEAAFRSVLLVFNLLGEFQRACGPAKWRTPASLRSRVFVCGAILGRSGHHHVLHLGRSWGGLAQRKPLLDKLRHPPDPTPPKLNLAPA